MRRTLVRNGTVYLEDGPETVDLLIENGRIADIGKFDHPIADCLTIDARGLHVLPGLIDIHTHLDDSIGGYRLADSWPSGSEIAIRSGITTLCSFITQRHGRPLSEAVEESLGKVGGRSSCDYSFHLTPVSFEASDWVYIEKLLADGFRTFKFYTTYRREGILTDYPTLKRLMARIKDMGAKVLVHCEDDEILNRSLSAVADRTAAFGHALSRPMQAEAEGIERVLEIAGQTRCPTHIVHVSSASGAGIIGRHKQDLPVTCETCPQYLFLDEEKLKGENGHRFICSPPLRSIKDKEELRQLAAAGAFDLYASDHCAFSKVDKDQNRGDFSKVPNGLPGIGTLAPLLYELHGDFGIIAQRLAANPARVADLYPRKGAIRKGSDADLAIFTSNGPETPVRSSLAEVYEPYDGKSTRILAKHVLLRGRLVAEDGAVLEESNHFGTRA